MKLFKRKLKFSKPRLLTCIVCFCVPVMAVVLFFADYRWRNRPIHVVIPARPVVLNNGLDDVAKAGQFLKKMMHRQRISRQLPEQYTIADFAAIAKEGEPVAAAIRLAIGKNYSGPSKRIDGAVPSSGTSGAELRAIGWQLTEAALFYDFANNHARANVLRLDAMEYGVMIAHGGAYLDQMYSNSMASVAAQNFEWSLKCLTDTELRYTLGRLSRIQSRISNFSEISQEEGSCEASWFMQSKSQSSTVIERYKSAVAGEFGDVPVIPKYAKFRDFAKLEFTDKTAQAQEILNYFRQLAEEVGLPYHDSLRTPLPANPFLEEISSTVSHIWSKHEITKSKIDLFRLEVALLLYKATNKRFPTNLYELAPQYLPSIPVDPFNNNKPFHYQVKPDDSYLLYGLGADMVDHHGKPGKYAGELGFDLVAGKLGTAPTFPKK